MILLGKDKVDERFNILEDGTIVDLNGNVQELKIWGDRPRFKGQLVHKIMMYTFYGYRNGKIWSIHHLDENKQNNSLSNLVYLTKSEHTLLHKKGNKYCLGRHHSEEAIKKISNALKGKQLSEEHKAKISEARLGKKRSPFSEEHKAKMSAAKIGEKNPSFGTHWWNNGIKSIKAKECPKGFVAGRLKWK